LTDLTRFRELALAIEQAQGVIREASRAGQGRGTAQDTGFMPFNLFDFGALLLESWALIPDEGTLLEVGAGAGGNLILARALGLNVYGIEISDALARIGARHGVPIETADAAAWEGYGKYAAIWMNRPRRDRQAEADLERKVLGAMAPGTVFMCANLELKPPDDWIIINDSWDSLHRGSWIKPYGGDGN
jgi:hypothetical protein